MTEFQVPTSATPLPRPLKPHRGAAVLVLGILGIVVCFICGIIAWVMGNQDLQEMDQTRPAAALPVPGASVGLSQ